MATDPPVTGVIMAGAPIHGRMLIEALLAAGRPAALIVNEVGTPRAQRLSQYLQNEYDEPQPLEALCPAGSRLLEVPHFAADQTVQAMGEMDIDYLILGGCGIIREPLLSSTRRGLLNMHPGLLPCYRGLDPVLWAVSHGQPVGATVHLVAAGIDEGDLLIARPMPWIGASTLLQLRLQVMRFGAGLLAEFLADPSAYPPQAQDHDQAGYYKDFPESAYAETEARLAHYVVDSEQGNRYDGEPVV